MTESGMFTPEMTDKIKFTKQDDIIDARSVREGDRGLNARAVTGSLWYGDKKYHQVQDGAMVRWADENGVSASSGYHSFVKYEYQQGALSLSILVGTLGATGQILQPPTQDNYNYFGGLGSRFSSLTFRPDLGNLIVTSWRDSVCVINPINRKVSLDYQRIINKDGKLFGLGYNSPAEKINMGIETQKDKIRKPMHEREKKS